MLFRTFAGALSVIESRAIFTVMDTRRFAVLLCAGLVIAGCESDPSESVASASASEADFSAFCSETVTASGNDRMAGLCPCLTDKVKEGADKEEITKVLKSSPQSMRQIMADLSEGTRNTIRGCMREAFAGGGVAVHQVRDVHPVEIQRYLHPKGIHHRVLLPAAIVNEVRVTRRRAASEAVVLVADVVVVSNRARCR